MKDEKICLVNGCFTQIPEHFDENESTQDQRYEHSPGQCLTLMEYTLKYCKAILRISYIIKDNFIFKEKMS